MASKHVSQYVLATNYVDIGSSYVYQDHNGEEGSFVFDKNRLVKTPGYEIILTDVDNLNFELQDDMIYMNVLRKEKWYHLLVNIAKQQEKMDEEEQ